MDAAAGTQSVSPVSVAGVGDTGQRSGSKKRSAWSRGRSLGGRRRRDKGAAVWKKTKKRKIRGEKEKQKDRK